MITSSELRHLAEELIEDLVEYRLNSGLTQQQVAHRIGINHTAISAFEHHRRNPGLEAVIRYADALGLELTFVAKERP